MDKISHHFVLTALALALAVALPSPARASVEQIVDGPRPLPAYAGGDLLEARKHLDAAVARAPGDARNHLALARTVAVKSQDRALFEKELALAAKGDDAISAADARALLSREEDLFGPVEGLGQK